MNSNTPISATPLKPLIDAASEQLDAANLTQDDRRAAGHILVACSLLLDIVRRQEQRQQQVAQSLNELANGIAYPISSVYQIRDSLRQIAAILRGETPRATP